jgi:MoaA/NifB/PqqE/SkfB family radical SAM enzyme
MSTSRFFDTIEQEGGDEVNAYAILKNRILRDSAVRRVPAAAEFELTSRCDFACPMCYVRTLAPLGELSTDWWKDLFRHAAEAGVLYALLTGGEPLLRPDFVELYEFLYDLGVKITVYTNGSLVDGRIVSCFRRRPPEFVGISLYGHDAMSMAAATGNPNAFRNVEDGIEALVCAGIDVALRTIPIRPVYDALDDLIAYAKRKNLRLGYQLYVGPRRDAPESAAKLRLDPDEVADFERRILEAFPAPASRPLHDETRHATCPALKSSCFVTWNGRMQPCALVSEPGMKVTPSAFFTTFRELARRMDEVPVCKECAVCGLREECLQCHARRTLEGNAAACSPYLRAIAEARRNRHE